MIDYIALTIGHALLGLAFWRLFGRDSLDHDPLLSDLQNEAREKRRELIELRQNELAPDGWQDGAR